MNHLNVQPMVRASFENDDWTIRSRVVKNVREKFNDVQVAVFSTHTNEVVFIAPQNRVKEIEIIIQNVIINKTVENTQVNRVLNVLTTHGAKLETDINVLDENYNLVKTNKIETILFGPCYVGDRQYCFRIHLVYNENGDIDVNNLIDRLNDTILTIKEYIKRASDLFEKDYQARKLIDCINVTIMALNIEFRSNK